MLLWEQRRQVVDYGKKMVEMGLVSGTFGNLSLFCPEENRIAISPTGMDYFRMEPEDVSVLTLEGERLEGEKPSSEYDMHRIFYQRSPGIRAVVHTHSTFATTLSCLRWSIEPIHYLIACAGSDVPCTPYLPFGTYELAQAAWETMREGRRACLLGNHGLLAVGESLPHAMEVAQQVEFLAQISYYCRAAGGGVPLTPSELAGAQKAFGGYRKV